MAMFKISEIVVEHGDVRVLSVLHLQELPDARLMRIVTDTPSPRVVSIEWTSYIDEMRDKEVYDVAFYLIDVGEKAPSKVLLRTDHTGPLPSALTRTRKGYVGGVGLVDVGFIKDAGSLEPTEQTIWRRPEQ